METIKTTDLGYVRLYGCKWLSEQGLNIIITTFQKIGVFWFRLSITQINAKVKKTIKIKLYKICFYNNVSATVQHYNDTISHFSTDGIQHALIQTLIVLHTMHKDLKSWTCQHDLFQDRPTETVSEYSETFY